MIYAAPHYYSKFKCLADKCPDTCCANWQISIDDRTFQKYMNVPGAEKNRFLNSIDIENKSFSHFDDKCSFLDENGLCDIQKDKGSDWLCRTCRNFPRHVEEFENVREYSISISCPEAANMILSDTDFDKFLTRVDNREEEYEYFDIDLYEALMASRKFILHNILKAPIDYKKKMAYSILFTYNLQARIDRGRTDLVKKFINKCIRNLNSEKNVEKLNHFGEHIENVNNAKKSIIDLFEKIDMTDTLWTTGIVGSIKNLQKMDNNEYDDLEYRFYHANTSILNQIIPAYMAYWITVYFNGAEYDYDAYAKMKFCCINTLLFIEMLKTESDTDTGEITFDKAADIAHRFSREVEHTVTNIESIENNLIYRGDLTLNSILACILK